MAMPDAEAFALSPKTSIKISKHARASAVIDIIILPICLLSIIKNHSYDIYSPL